MQNDRQQVVRELPCTLNDEEIRTCGQKLAGELIALKEQQEEKASIVEGFKERKEASVKRIDDLTAMIRDRIEHRDVDCEWRYDWGGNVKQLTRLDTAEVIEVQAISPEERQLRLVDNADAEERKESGDS